MWKKLIALVVVIILMTMIFMERSNTTKFLDDVNQQTEACKRQSESLSTQLAVVNAHRKKLDEALLAQQIQMNEAVHDLNSKILNILNEKKELVTKYETCVQSKSIVVHDENVTQITEENERQKKEIMALRTELESLKASIQNPVNNVQTETADQVPQLHPPEEHKGYADGDTVHFHRKVPHSAALEFRRDDEPMQVPQLFSKKDLIKKIEERKKLREKNENVIDYQQNKKPDNMEQDYKEME